MAPFVPSTDISDLNLSSLELDARSTVVDIIQVSSKHIFKREPFTASPSPVTNLHSLAVRSQSTKTPDHGGAVNPNDINMKGIQALIAIIGTSFVLGIIWFFFWAKNGGFKWQKGDWDDYKSTVLRRKGPNGTTLSNASKSTKLGGGSVVGEGYSDGTASQWGGTMTETMTETMTDLSSEAPIIKENRKSRNKETAKERKVREAKAAHWEGGHDEDMQAYIREKPAQVGGINRDSDALHYGTDYTDTEGSAVHSQTHRTSRPPSQAPRHVSTPRQPSPEKHQSRRDFSFGNEEAFSTVSSSQPDMPPQTYPDIPPQAPPHRPGRYHQPQPQPQPPQHQSDPRRPSQYPRHNIPGGYQESVSDVQSQHTKTYHHVIPGLGNNAAASPGGPSQQQNRGGYRRDRRDSFD